MSDKNQMIASEMSSLQRLRVVLRGAVQGVGFRPFVYRLARELLLPGWVTNSPGGVVLEVEGPLPVLQEFLLRLPREKPVPAFVQSLESTYLDPAGYSDFEIRPSPVEGRKRALILPDIATCPECLRELFDPANRRYRYPFINCTHCGPRFSIVESLPYDRSRTTMKGFRMCLRCQQEYDTPTDRRFHAQPNACPVCGPQITSWDGQGRPLAREGAALQQVIAALRSGKIVALKGVGGFQLLTLAQNSEAVRRLRARKHRDEKPFAVMVPDVAAARRMCDVSPLEERLLRSSEAPIVLLRRITGLSSAEDAVAPRNPYLGVMLPYSPLHHLLMSDLQEPVVATSGNFSDEPICTDEREALERLRGIADEYLVHNRPIARHVDDSVARVILGREQVLRRARGYAPLPIPLEADARPLLAVGAQMKSAVSLTCGRNIFVSQHIGDLETMPALEAFQRVVRDFETLYEETPEAVACDMHPGYLSTYFAEQSTLPVIRVQHHYAHVLSCMADNGLTGPALGVAWDGTGLGLDGTLWGGEFLNVHEQGFDRLSHIRTFTLPGGERAIKEPRRVALGLLYEILGDRLFSLQGLAPLESFPAAQREPLLAMLRQRVQCPVTSSVGRLFDAVASLIGLRQVLSFEGQAAMELEYIVTPNVEESYAFEDQGSVLDWEPMVRGILGDLGDHVPPGRIAAKFHNGLVEMMVQTARRAGKERVVLSGGCFQNRTLTERAVTRLRAEGFRPYWHQRIPPHDGGIAVGQLVAAAESLGRRTALLQGANVLCA